VSQNWLPREKREPLGEYINVYFEEKKVLSQMITEKRHSEVDQSELNTIKVE
jgi:hypothetical protein